MEEILMTKKFITGMNELIPSDDLKRITLQKMNETKKENNKIIITFFNRKSALFASAAIILVVTLLFTVFNSKPLLVSAKTEDLMKGITPKNVETQALSEDFINSSADFSFDLFKNCVKKGENTLISPTSVFLALGLTANGANGETKKEFEKLLGRYGLDINELNTNYLSYIKELTSPRKFYKSTLKIADSIWYNNEFTPNKPFLQTNADFFSAGAFKADFNKSSTVNDINNWVKEHTNKLIDKVIDKIDPQSVMYIINTLYFNDAWGSPFFTKDNVTQDFNLQSGEPVKSVFMSKSFFGGGVVKYIEGNDAKGVVLSYEDSRYLFVAIMPNNGITLADYINKFNKDAFNDMIKNANYDIIVNLKMPKFKSGYTIELKDVLIKMGLKDAFDMQKSDFSNMGNGNIFIAQVLHKTFIKVNEMGTEAGAVTMVNPMTGGDYMPSNKVDITLDRPFLYAIIDNKTNLPLFIGTMENPQQ
jgi:serine protease inhibitor